MKIKLYLAIFLVMWLKNIKASDIVSAISNRLKVCLPLMTLKVNSHYGWRNDPINHLKIFHKGIDLKAHYERVFSMLYGKVIDIGNSTAGYGNYIVIKANNIIFKYAHLNYLFVQVGDTVRAGDVVAISGNTGRTTGPHLHIEVKLENQLIDPLNLINFIAMTCNNFDQYFKLKDVPNVIGVYNELLKQKIKFPAIVLAQSILETGYYSSNVCNDMNNLFGLRMPKTGKYYQFKNWRDSVKAYRDYVEYKYIEGDYYDFLQRIGYAEDPQYILKLKNMEKTINRIISKT